jgi:uncharacterized cupredoxin-like copper-binding protein
LTVAVAIVGFHNHTHSHGDLTVRDSTGRVVTIADWKIGDQPTRLTAVLQSGNLAFSLQNTDQVAHDFVVVRTDSEGGALPMKVGRVDVANAGEVVASVESFAPGEQRTMSFRFSPGRYVLFCNQAGHYQRGMYYSFEVQ